MIAGDFNQWGIANALVDYIDIKEINMGATRGSLSIDRTFANFGTAIVEADTLPPLQPDSPGEGAPSDHRVTFLTSELPKIKTFKWLKHSYRHYNEDSVKLFQDWLVPQEWEDVLCASGSQAKAVLYQNRINGAIENFFQLITVRRKDTDAPWINEKVRRLIKKLSLIHI